MFLEWNSLFVSLSLHQSSTRKVCLETHKREFYAMKTNSGRHPFDVADSLVTPQYKNQITESIRSSGSKQLTDFLAGNVNRDTFSTSSLNFGEFWPKAIHLDSADFCRGRKSKIEEAVAAYWLSCTIPFIKRLCQSVFGLDHGTKRLQNKAWIYYPFTDRVKLTSLLTNYLVNTEAQRSSFFSPQ